MTCHSGGTLEIYVEPHLPAPSLWLAGTTPIVGALATLGAATGWRVSVFDPIADEEAFPGAERVSTVTALGRVDPELSPYVVVATQGIWDEEALAAALRRDVSYVGPGGVADALRRRPRLAARRGQRARGAAGGAARARRASTSAPRRPRRSRSRSWPSSSRSGGAARRSWRVRDRRRWPASRRSRPTRVARARRRRHRPARPGLRDDRGPRARPAPRGARRRRVRLLLDGLPDRVHQGARRVRGRLDQSRGLTPPARRPTMQFEGTVDIAAPRDRVWAFLMDPNQVGTVRARRGVDRGRSTRTTSRRRRRWASGSSRPSSWST